MYVNNYFFVVVVLSFNHRRRSAEFHSAVSRNSILQDARTCLSGGKIQRSRHLPQCRFVNRRYSRIQFCATKYSRCYERLLHAGQCADAPTGERPNFLRLTIFFSFLCSKL